MMTSVVGRAAFSRLRSDGQRYRSGPLRCRYVSTPDEPRRAFAIGRKFGSAVQRNRARRRIDAAIDTVARARPVPPGDYLLSCSPRVLHVPFGELVQSAERMFDQIQRLPDVTGCSAGEAGGLRRASC